MTPLPAGRNHVGGEGSATTTQPMTPPTGAPAAANDGRGPEPDWVARLRAFVLPTLKGYRHAWLRPDLYASLILWTLLVPQGLAYAQAAGLPPQYGLYAALGAMAGYALIGVSRQVTVGPEATVALLSATAVAPLAVGDASSFAALSAALGILVGLACAAIGLMRLGFLARLLSRPVLAGYLVGTGVTMIISQVDKLLGVDVSSYDALTMAGQTWQALGDANLVALAIGLAVIVGILLLRRFAPSVPAYLVAVVVATAVTGVFQLDAKQGVDVVGTIPAGLPGVTLPRIGIEKLGSLILPAVGIAFLVFADSGITARAIARRTGDAVDQDRHMLGMGMANVAAGLVSGFAVNASTSRSFAVADAGGRSQVVGLVGLALIAITLLFLAPLFAQMPLAALGGITVVVAMGLIDVAELRRIGRYDRTDLALALATTAGVIWIGMLAGILVVVLLSLLDVARRSAAPNRGLLVRVPGTDTYRRVETVGAAVPDAGLAVYRFDAPLFFANVEIFVDDVLGLARGDGVTRRPVLVDAEAITALDSTAAQALSEMLDELAGMAVPFGLARVKAPLRDRLEAAGVLEQIGEDHIYLEVDEGVAGMGERS